MWESTGSSLSSTTLCVTTGGRWGRCEEREKVKKGALKQNGPPTTKLCSITELLYVSNYSPDIPTKYTTGSAIINLHPFPLQSAILSQEQARTFLTSCNVWSREFIPPASSAGVGTRMHQHFTLERPPDNTCPK